MLLPHMWLRKKWLDHALLGYPVYEPPHKIEERLLSREQAQENFDYFMAVRLLRLESFQRWLYRYFFVRLTPDREGVRKLNRWANKYSGLLLAIGIDGHPADTYLNYEPSWGGEHIGCNVVFDMGIAMGEFTIAQCPNLRWDFDPISSILPRTAERLKRTAGMSFQRPMLTGFDNPVFGKIPLHDVYISVAEIQEYLITYSGINRFYARRTAKSRSKFRCALVVNFDAALRDYPRGDPNNERAQMSDGEYLKLVDSESGVQEHDHE